MKGWGLFLAGLFVGIFMGSYLTAEGMRKEFTAAKIERLTAVKTEDLPKAHN